MLPIRDFKVAVSEWVQPENIDVWYQMLTVQTGSHEQTIGARLAISGHELTHFGLKHPSQLPRKVALEHTKDLCVLMIDTIDQKIQDEARGEN